MSLGEIAFEPYSSELAELEHVNPSDLVLRRLAGGLALSQLCADLKAYAAPYSNIDVRSITTESFSFRPGTEVVDKRSVRRNDLIGRGFTPAGIEAGLTEAVPSVLEEQRVIGESVRVDDNGLGEFFIGVRFDPEHAEQLRCEKVAVWAHLAQRGNFDLGSLPWLDRVPDMRLAYVDADGDIKAAEMQAKKLGEIAEGYLGSKIRLAPLFETDAFPFNYDDSLTTTIIDELTGNAVPAVTISGVQKFIERSGLDFGPQTATRLFNTVRDAMPRRRRDVGVDVENFVAGRVETSTDSEEAREFGMRVRNIPDLIAFKISSLAGVGDRSAALFHAFTDSLLVEDA